MDGETAGFKPSARETDVEHASKVVEKLLAAAQPGAVFGPPVKDGNYTVITASEVASGGGFGFGGASGPAPRQTGPEPAVASGSGGGGGGGSSGRPVAVIVIGPDGVMVKPVIDVTKLAIVAITAWGAMAVAMRKMLKAGRS